MFKFGGKDHCRGRFWGSWDVDRQRGGYRTLLRCCGRQAVSPLVHLAGRAVSRTSGLVFSRTARNSAAYLASSMLGSLLPLLLLPFLVRYITPREFGHLAVLQSLIAVGSVVVSFGLAQPYFRAAALLNRDERASYFGSCIAIMTAVFLAALMLIVSWPELFAAAQLPVYWAVAALATAFALCLKQLYLMNLRADREPLRYGLIENVYTAANVALSLGLVLAAGLGWRGRALGIFASAVAMCPLVLYLAFANRAIRWPKAQYIREALKAGLAIMPHSLSGVTVSYADRFILIAQFSLPAVGPYAATAQLAQALYLGSAAMNLALGPWSYAQLRGLASASDLRSYLRDILLLSVLATIAAIIFYAGLRLAFPLIMPASYDGALVYLPWLVAGIYFNTLYFIFSAPLFYYQKTEVLAVSGLFILTSGIAAMFLFAYLFGPVGVAMGLCSARLLLFIIATVASARLLVADCRRRGIDIRPALDLFGALRI
jgi:O-antigen/teichoic acid export membrane protein